MFKAMKFKVVDAEQSEQLQKVLHQLGYKWHDIIYRSKMDMSIHPVISTDAEGYIGYDLRAPDYYMDHLDNHEEVNTAGFIAEHFVSETPVQISDKPASEKTISLSTLLNEHGTPNARDLLLKAAQGPVGVNDKQPALIQAVGAYNALTGQSMTVAEGNLFMALAHVASAEGDEESALGYLARYLVPNK